MAHRDYEESIAGLNAHRVRYLVVGAHAVGFHARPRATKDLDLFVQPTRANAKRLLDALADFFGGTPPGYTVDDILDPGGIIQLGVAPVRIDLISALIGVPSFAAAWRARVEARFGRASASYISLADQSRTKAAAGRPQDLVDLETLRRVPARRSRTPRRGVQLGGPGTMGAMGGPDARRWLWLSHAFSAGAGRDGPGAAGPGRRGARG